MTDTGTIPATPEELARKCRAGDDEAFGELLRLFGNRVFGFIRQSTGNQQDAEDLTQETFLRVYRSLPRFDPSRSFETWIFAIARHVLASHFRRHRATVAIEFDEAADPQPSPASRAEETDRIRHVWTVARRLKPEFFQVLWLHYAEGFQTQEVARIMRRTRVHVKVMLHRARAQLAQRLPQSEA